MINTKITGHGIYIPPKVETAKDLAKKIGKSEEWIINSTGVNERRISEIDVDEMAAIACKEAIGNSSPPDLIINASGVPKQTIPDVFHVQVWHLYSLYLSFYVPAYFLLLVNFYRVYSVYGALFLYVSLQH